MYCTYIQQYNTFALNACTNGAVWKSTDFQCHISKTYVKSMKCYRWQIERELNMTGTNLTSLEFRTQHDLIIMKHSNMRIQWQETIISRQESITFCINFFWYFLLMPVPSKNRASKSCIFSVRNPNMEALLIPYRENYFILSNECCPGQDDEKFTLMFVMNKGLFNNDS